MEAGLANLLDAISGQREAHDATYLQSLHATRTELLEYAVEMIELGERRARGVPPAALASVRFAARSGVSLDTVLRRYSAGQAMFGDVLVEEAQRAEVSSAALRQLLHRQATAFDRLFEAVSEEHARETRSRPTTTAGWHFRHISALLAGRQPNPEVKLDYDFDGNHIGLMARGEEAHGVMRELARRLDRNLLAGRNEEEPDWVCWLGGRTPLETERAVRALEEMSLDQVLVALGEPGEGLTGFRLSHRQAKAALPIAERRGQHVVRYSDVAVLASILRDDLGATSLRRLYLEPLEAGRDGGKAARDTLRAYFSTERNISSTAAALQVDRRTVSNRLRAVEELFGRPLSDFATNLEAALQLAD